MYYNSNNDSHSQEPWDRPIETTRSVPWIMSTSPMSPDTAERKRAAAGRQWP